MTLRPAHLCFELMAAVSDGRPDAPEWIQLLPLSAGRIETVDGRGPYTVGPDLGRLIAESFREANADKLVLDENHATDIRAPRGEEAPARGWIVEMAARADGIWGRVEWTEEGRALVASRAYRYVSPVVMHDQAGRIHSIPRASLVNRANLRGIAALNATSQEDDHMNPMASIAEALGLSADASAEDILAAIGRMKAGKTGDQTATQAALQSQLETANTAVAALQAQVADLAAEASARAEADRRGRAETFVDAAIRDGRAGLNSGTRDYFVGLHMADPARTEEAISKMPKLGRTDTTAEPPRETRGEASLNAAQQNAARLLGIPVDKYAATLSRDAARKEAH
jgi:phage I-like protein